MKLVMLLLIWLSLGIGGVTRVEATPCIIYDCGYNDPETGIYVPMWCDGCGGNVDYCQPNYHLGDDGETCAENGTEEEEGGCFPAGTKITMASGESKAIEDVVVGDMVMSQGENGETAASRVERLIRPVSDSMCRIEFDSGDSLEVTESHPFLTDQGWRAIDEEAARAEQPGVEIVSLEVGDAMYKEDGTRPRVTGISCWSEKSQVYNFTVDNAHTYFAGGYLAHNKGEIGRGGCIAPENVNCSANIACVPGNNFYCSTYNVNYNSSSSTPFDGPAGNETCRLGNAQTSDRSCNPWFCGYTVTTYTCCPTGTVSSYSYSYQTYTNFEKS